jgi:hypothetical protein
MVTLLHQHGQHKQQWMRATALRHHTACVVICAVAFQIASSAVEMAGVKHI